MKVKNFIKENLCLTERESQDESRLDKLSDSLGLTQLIMDIEDEYDISVTEDVKNCKTVGDLVRYIEKLLE